MRLFGWDVVIRKAARGLHAVGSWIRMNLDIFPGAWQQDVKVDQATVERNWAVFACVTLIAGDIGKMIARVMQYNSTTRVYDQTLHRPVLRKPNRYQNRIDFLKQWVYSLLLHGNMYALKERDAQGKIVALYILDPCRVTPLVAADGSVFYQLASDNLSGIEQAVTVPASEIIHDRVNALWHPLVGTSPIYACGMAAMQGSAIQQNSAKFFQNMSRPSGILTAPGNIANDTAKRLKDDWQANFSGGNIGRVAVLGDGLKYEAMTISAVDSQLIEQLKFTGEMICATFHVPPYKLGLGQMPTVSNTGTLNQGYYDQALQPMAESIELRLEEGLELDFPYEVWMDETVLLRMDPAARYEGHSKAIQGGWLAPNEARREENRAPAPGGDSPMMQQQNYSLAALERRDAKAIDSAQVSVLQALLTAGAKGELPVDSTRAAIRAAFPLLSDDEVNAMVTPLQNFVPPAPPTPTPPPAGNDGDEPDDAANEARAFVELIEKGLAA